MARDLFFSVIIPTLNEEVELPKILSDLAAQKQKNFEVIIVDANSKDKTKEAALKFSESFPLEFYSVKKLNVAYQRNFGAQNARREFLIFLDADARMGSQFTKNLQEGILEKKTLLVLPALFSEDRSLKERLIFKVVNLVVKLSQLSPKPLSAGGAIFISRKLFSDLGGFREDLHMSEDHDLIQRARKLGIKAEILKNVEVSFSMRRVKKEGQIRTLYKYFLALFCVFFNRKVTSKMVKYEMGGDKFRDPNPQKCQS